MTSATRKAHLALADDRAMEWENERMNPINPKAELTKNKNGLMSGGSATPSMGLSQFRGGMLSRTSGKTSVAYAPPSEAHQMGLHLGKHLVKLHGGAYHKDFMTGMAGGGGYDDDEPEGYVRPETKFDEHGHRIPSTGSVNEVRAQHAKENYNKKASTGERLAGKVVSGLSDVGREGLQNLHKIIPAPGVKEAGQFVSDLIPHGGARTGAYEGKGRKKRQSAPPSSGRHKRAEIVKRVMGEKGLSMIEASKYVKQHGLY